MNNKRRTFCKLSLLSATLLLNKIPLYSMDTLRSKYTSLMYTNEYAFLYSQSYLLQSYLRQTKNLQLYAHNGVVTKESSQSFLNAAEHSFSQIIYQKDRILYPMRNLGSKEKPNFQRISWAMALNILANKIQKSKKKVLFNIGSPLQDRKNLHATLSFASTIKATTNGASNYAGSLFSGLHLSLAQSTIMQTPQAIQNAKTALVWGANPMVSDLEQAKLLLQAKHNGCKLIVITPEVNATASKASLHLQINPGSDAFLAMSLIHTIINEKLYDEHYIKEQTDLCLLVDIKTQKLLRKEHTDDIFYTYDTQNQSIVPLSEENNNIALEVEGNFFAISDDTGKTKQVTTVFEMLKSSASEFPAELTQTKTNIAPHIVHYLARSLAKEQNLSVILGNALNKYFNGIQTTWNIASLLGLLGKTSSLNAKTGFKHYDIKELVPNNHITPSSALVNNFMQKESLEYFSDTDILRAQNISKEAYKNFIDDAISSEKRAYYDSDVIVNVASNSFNTMQKNRNSFLTCLDYRFSTTALCADLILPVKMPYENIEGIQSVGEARSEAEIFEKLQEKFPQQQEQEDGIVENVEITQQKRVQHRQTYYIDHPYYIAMDACCNSAFENPTPLRDATQTFQLLMPHSRYSINSTLKTSRTLLRMNRGKPYITLHPNVAAQYHLQDNELVKIFNDLGTFYAHVKISPSTLEQCIIIESGYEAFMHPHHKNVNAVLPTSINLLELADDYRHLKFSKDWDGNNYIYEAAVQLEKVSSSIKNSEGNKNV